MAGFEGFEKRLELQFTGHDDEDHSPTSDLGLRRLCFQTLESILHLVQCTVVSAVSNHYFDSYVLSESSLFIYPNKIIIKTCGTTQLLKSVRPFIRHARDLGLSVCGCKYTRGSFIFPDSQPYPHSSFKDEVVYLEESLPDHLCYKKATVMPSNLPSMTWHVFAAADESHLLDNFSGDTYTVEVCMTKLDQTLARKFFRRPHDGKGSDLAGKEMTEITGIGDINPNALICDFAFDPCGYSMNGIDGDRYSTIHVTPEDGFSYASFECIGSAYDVGRVVKKAVQVFRPAIMSVALTCPAGRRDLWARIGGALKPMGYKCRSCVADEFPTNENIVFQTFSTRMN
ncbi:S-adenosylmethionine decarboxylase proenzyme 4-like [Impatiens glandulifera]|uniref:S-adenosylmethionine decarboxylase proenzyme 4-like n=1 Tax=Impatiens glandulifera TaxID=253017 RepID=UPI001FB193E1|nr:S-adenosylmethionine decarboxylase proenzyme 4-like [Impatiens glandulifera]